MPIPLDRLVVSERFTAYFALEGERVEFTTPDGQTVRGTVTDTVSRGFPYLIHVDHKEWEVDGLVGLLVEPELPTLNLTDAQAEALTILGRSDKGSSALGAANLRSANTIHHRTALALQRLSLVTVDLGGDGEYATLTTIGRNYIDARS